MIEKSQKKLNVVLLHDWLTGFRGGERVLEVFCEMFPEAPIYTLLHQKGSTSDIIESRTIKTSFLNWIPGIHKHYRKFLPLMPLAASRLHISEDADLVLSSSHCVIKGVTKPKDSKHISYIHSPMRYIYDQFEVYFGAHAPFYQRFGAKLFRNYLTKWDLNSNKNVDYPIANAEFVRERITKHYNISSDVVHPFVDLKDFVSPTAPTKEDYFIMVTAFAPNKRVDLAIKTFNKLKLPLKIIGGGQEEERLRDLAGATIEFLGNVSREDVVTRFKKARALIFPGVEDFGITPLESLASGTPVIAFRKGGVLETLNENVAVFFDEQNEASLSQALHKFIENEHQFDHAVLVKRANDFSKEAFRKNIEQIVSDVLGNSSSL
ncbi:MAG: glycosyltransferase [Bacteriovoracaceae bacterium]|jgi:glycosyltransferase involved in cell wall biosynthesis|nr:glycosyltransferase [Bacteriovoracaceae bacterium]